jgi:hypothetical protein
MLPKVSRKNNRVSGTAGGESGAQRRACDVIPGLQINLKKIMAGYYRVFIAHWGSPYFGEYPLLKYMIIHGLTIHNFVIYQATVPMVVRDINDNFRYFYRKCY